VQVRIRNYVLNVTKNTTYHFKETNLPREFLVNQII